MKIYDELFEANPEALTPDGLETAYVGHTTGGCRPSVAVYDVEKCILATMKDLSITREQAEEYLEHNTFCAYVGEHGPLYVVRR